MRRVLISGAAGFLGTWLARELAASWRVVGTDLAALPPRPGLEWVAIEDEIDGLPAVVERTSPDLLLHAAFVNKQGPDVSEEKYLGRQLRTNVALFRRCARLGVPVVLVSSSAVYGMGSSAAGFGEEAPRRPVSLYGLAKAIQEMLGEQLAAAAGLRLCTARLFNLVGPGQGAGMLVPDWVSQIAAMERGAEPVLRVKTLATRRDFVDVRDAARALGLLADRFTAGEVYNVASGRAVALRELADLLASLSPVRYRTVEASDRPASTDAVSQDGDPSKIRDAYGWTPTIHWQQSVRDFWNEYRSRGQARPAV